MNERRVFRLSRIAKDAIRNYGAEFGRPGSLVTLALGRGISNPTPSEYRVGGLTFEQEVYIDQKFGHIETTDANQIISQELERFARAPKSQPNGGHLIEDEISLPVALLERARKYCFDTGQEPKYYLPTLWEVCRQRVRKLAPRMISHRTRFGGMFLAQEPKAIIATSAWRADPVLQEFRHAGFDDMTAMLTVLESLVGEPVP